MNAAGDPSAEAERLLKGDTEWAALASAGQNIDRILYGRVRRRAPLLITLAVLRSR
jgi:hypothetical protein